MIKITQPIIEKRKDGMYLTSTFVDENANKSTEIWYRTTDEYAPYLNDESADAFVLLALLPAIYSHQNIEVQGTLSEKLYYQLSTTGIYTLTKMFYPSQAEPTITISCEKIRKLEIKKGESFAVGCGCSLGVDSLSAIGRHLPPPASIRRRNSERFSIDTPYLF